MSAVMWPLTVQLLFLAAFFVSIAANSVQNNTIKVGYFMSTDPYRAAALNLAIDQAQSEGFMSHYNIRYLHSLKYCNFYPLVHKSWMHVHILTILMSISLITTKCGSGVTVKRWICD